jgi:TFIIF-interacting CTD phosphatase-like protein
MPYRGYRGSFCPTDEKIAACCFYLRKIKNIKIRVYTFILRKNLGLCVRATILIIFASLKRIILIESKKHSEKNGPKHTNPSLNNLNKIQTITSSLLVTGDA